MTKVIGVIQLKGGAGKSTVATNLAGMLNEKGSTLLIDSDEPQYSAEGWYLLREEAGRTDGLKFSTCNDETLPAHSGQTVTLITLSLTGRHVLRGQPN